MAHIVRHFFCLRQTSTEALSLPHLPPPPLRHDCSAPTGQNCGLTHHCLLKRPPGSPLCAPGLYRYAVYRYLTPLPRRSTPPSAWTAPSVGFRPPPAPA